MKHHLQYLSYVIRHKWYVLIECFKAGLYWRGITHDLSKFRLGEWIPYANYFGNRGGIKSRKGYYKPTDTGDSAFDYAWLLHQKRNDHHWQWFVLPEDSGGVKILPMSQEARLEMICDWRGASKAQGRGPDITEWYEAHKHKMQLHKETREWIEERLGVVKL